MNQIELKSKWNEIKSSELFLAPWKKLFQYHNVFGIIISKKELEKNIKEDRVEFFDTEKIEIEK